jgi:hypothetical protein
MHNINLKSKYYKCIVLSIIFVNDNKEVNVTTPQISKCCSFCYNKPILNLNPIIQARKGLI